MVEINANTYLIFRRTDLSRLNFVALGLYGERPYDFSISRVPTSADRALKSWRHDTVVKRSVGQCEGLNKPSLLVATRMRKLMACVTQLLSLTEGDLNQVLNHMGHTCTRTSTGITTQLGSDWR